MLTILKTFHKICNTHEPLQIVFKDNDRFIVKLKTQGTPWSKKIVQEMEIVVASMGLYNSIVDSVTSLKNRAYGVKFIYLALPTQDDFTYFHVLIAIPKNKFKNRNLRLKILAYLYFNFAFIAQTWEFRRESRVIFETKSNLENPVLN